MNRRFVVILVILGVLFAAVAFHERRTSQAVRRPPEVPIGEASGGLSAKARKSSMAEVLRLAEESLESMIRNVNDYTARFVKQERDTSGQLGELTEMNIKVMTRHRDGRLGAPMRVYLEFLQPAAVRGREVIWAEDLHEGKIVVHEGGLLGLITARLDPHGFMAMRGQRFPISEIGLTRLVEQLIERGKLDVDNPDVTVTITPGFRIDDVNAELIRVQRSKSNGASNDFSLAEIAYDRDRLLILRYRSFGWPEAGESAPPLLESYTYHDIQTNVGLTERDFDPDNPAYRYP